MSLISRRQFYSLCAATLAAALAPTLAIAAPSVWVRLDGFEWIPVPMYSNSVEQTLANFSVGWPKGVKVETCVMYGDRQP